MLLRYFLFINVYGFSSIHDKDLYESAGVIHNARDGTILHPKSGEHWVVMSNCCDEEKENNEKKTKKGVHLTVNNHNDNNKGCHPGCCCECPKQMVKEIIKTECPPDDMKDIVDLEEDIYLPSKEAEMEAEIEAKDAENPISNLVQEFNDKETNWLEADINEDETEDEEEEAIEKPLNDLHDREDDLLQVKEDNEAQELVNHFIEAENSTIDVADQLIGADQELPITTTTTTKAPVLPADLQSAVPCDPKLRTRLRYATTMLTPSVHS